MRFDIDNGFSGVVVFVNGWDSYDEGCRYGEIECGHFCCSECCVDETISHCGYGYDCDQDFDQDLDQDQSSSATLIIITILTLVFVILCVGCCCFCCIRKVFFILLIKHLVPKMQFLNSCSNLLLFLI